jgi:hypothetical protein
VEREMALNKIHANRGGPLADNARAATLIMFDSNRNILFKKEFDDIEQSAPSLMYTSSTIVKWKIVTIKWLWLVIIWLYFDDETINIAIFLLGITIL